MAVKKTNNPAATEPEKIEKLFSKEQLLAAERFYDAIARAREVPGNVIGVCP